jgi:hypothetical protein
VALGSYNGSVRLRIRLGNCLVGPFAKLQRLSQAWDWDGTRLARPFAKLQRLSEAWDRFGESPSESVQNKLLKEMSRASAIDNDRPNKMAYALPFTDFQTMVTYGWDSARPRDAGWWPLVKYLIMRFIVMTLPMFAKLQWIG